MLAVLGPRKFKAMQKSFGGQRLWIPKPGATLSCGACLTRNSCILVWRRQGHSVDAIAKFLNISPKTVYRIARTPSPPSAP